MPPALFRVGTASWTDPTLIASGAFYPADARSAEERLRFYAEHWKKKGISVAERYQYLYSERELAEWAGRLRQLGAGTAHVLFNNCYANFGVMNAGTMRQMLKRAGG